MFLQAQTGGLKERYLRMSENYEQERLMIYEALSDDRAEPVSGYDVRRKKKKWMRKPRQI